MWSPNTVVVNIRRKDGLWHADSDELRGFHLLSKSRRDILADVPSAIVHSYKENYGTDADIPPYVGEMEFPESPPNPDSYTLLVDVEKTGGGAVWFLDWRDRGFQLERP